MFLNLQIGQPKSLLVNRVEAVRHRAHGGFVRDGKAPYQNIPEIPCDRILLAKHRRRPGVCLPCKKREKKQDRQNGKRSTNSDSCPSQTITLSIVATVWQIMLSARPTLPTDSPDLTLTLSVSPIPNLVKAPDR